jgi:hypothetical protein
MAQPGQQYEVVVASGDFGYGNYQVAYNGATFDQQLSPNGSMGSGNTLGMGAAKLSPIASQVFSQTPVVA